MITVENLAKTYGEVRALKGLTLHISSGEILAVVGPSGCGKTTLLRLIAGFESPDAGRILIDGVKVSSRTTMVQPYDRGLSMIFQDLALWPHMTVREHIEFVLRKNQLPKDVLRWRASEICKDVNLEGLQDRRPHALSGGEKQRLAIGRAIASRPNYLLMDEPFSNLDPILRGELQSLVTGLKARLRMGMIYVTHQIGEALAMADSVAILREGRLEQVDGKAQILSRPRNEFIRRYLGIG